MEGIDSLSTLPTTNKICIKNKKCKGSICEKCYSHTVLKYRKSFYEMLKNNFQYLSKKLIPENEIPPLNYAYFRFESHGELINNIHLTNLVNIVEKNKHCKFAIYTKNYKLTENYFKTIKKPKNLILIYSSLYIGKPLDIKDFQFADKIFTVYTDVSKAKIINCKQKCFDCLKCYTHNKIQYINEFEKSIKKRKDILDK